MVSLGAILVASWQFFLVVLVLNCMETDPPKSECGAKRWPKRGEGETLEAARWALPVLEGGNRCPTGDAKITVAGDLPCSKVIHAVGPAFGYSPTLADHADKLELLEAAYKSAMERARENALKSVGFCILSAGIFRGGCPLKVVIETGLETIAKNTYPGLETVVFCGFTPQEQAELSVFADSVA